MQHFIAEEDLTAINPHTHCLDPIEKHTPHFQLFEHDFEENATDSK